MARKRKFTTKEEMLAFLREIGKRNEAAIKRLDKALQRETTLVEALEAREPFTEYKRLKK